jgi:hypothetical protein
VKKRIPGSSWIPMGELRSRIGIKSKRTTRLLSIEDRVHIPTRPLLNLDNQVIKM